MAILAECPICHRKQSAKKKRCRQCGEDLDKAKRARKVRFWISYRMPDGKQKREFVGSFEGLKGHSIEDAKKAEAKKMTLKAEKKLMDVRNDTKMTFQELSDWYLGLEKVKVLSSYWRVKMSLQRFNEEFGGKIVSTIKPADLENYQVQRKVQGKADATIDQEIGAAKRVIYKGFDNDLVGGDTLKSFKSVEKLLKSNGNARDRVLSPDEFKALLEHSSRHLRGILAMGYYTGMREGEILNLTWDKVDMKNRLICLEASDTKDKESRRIPICDELFEILRTVPRALHEKHVFLYRGKPLGDIRNSLRKACDAAGIVYGRFEKDGFVFHDLRHTFNTYMRKAGIPESVIMEVTGHSTREMFDRYNTVDVDDTRQAIEQFQDYLRNVDQTVDQKANSENDNLL